LPLVLRLWPEVERVPLLPLFFAPAPAAEVAPISKDNARKLERIIFMQLAVGGGSENSQ
jgi:hypothetical protein